MNIQEEQRYVIDSIKKELYNESIGLPSSVHSHSVWFRPLTGRFLFDDLYIRYEIIEPLIENKTLVYKGIESYQGELMLRYVLK